MLRRLVLIVVVLNLALAGAIWAVNSGRWVWPDAWRGEVHEPERLSRQVNPEAIMLKPTAKTSMIPTSAPTAVLASTVATATPRTLCLQSTGNEAQIASAASNALKEIAPTALVQTLTSKEGGMWMVYMGKYATPAAASSKLAELDDLNIPGDYEIIRDAAAFQPGISLGAFRDPERAGVRLAELAKKGVNSAKVVVRSAPREVSTLKLPELEPGLREKANEAVTKAGGKPLELCPAN